MGSSINTGGVILTPQFLLWIYQSKLQKEQKKKGRERKKEIK